MSLEDALAKYSRLPRQSIELLEADASLTSVDSGIKNGRVVGSILNWGAPHVSEQFRQLSHALGEP